MTFSCREPYTRLAGDTSGDTSPGGQLLLLVGDEKQELVRPARVRVTGDLFHGKVPDGALYVGRSAPGMRRSPYANPYSVKTYGLTESRRLFRGHTLPALDLAPLRGLVLACWCPLDSEWCHADDLLRAANRPDSATIAAPSNPLATAVNPQLEASASDHRSEAPAKDWPA